MKHRSLVYFLSLLIAALTLQGCVSVMEKTGRVLDGSAFKDKNIAHYRAQDIDIRLVNNKESGLSVIISINRFPMMYLRASEPDENGAFYLTSLEYLSGGIQSWNEYTLDLLGDGELIMREDDLLAENAVFSISGEIEPVQISAGRIHRFDTRLTGIEALTGLRNRKERITATVAWMSSQENAPKEKELSLEDFEKYWKPILFPEMVSKKKRPQGWQQDDDIFVRAEGIRWNTGYTERAFSEELRPVRDSGTMLRDWEEALAWLYLEYEWENIKEILSQKTILIKYK